jgi:hypothetical protein
LGHDIAQVHCHAIRPEICTTVSFDSSQNGFMGIGWWSSALVIPSAGAAIMPKKAVKSFNDAKGFDLVAPKQQDDRKKQENSIAKEPGNEKANKRHQRP